jgi:hypothetical protein
MAIITHKDRARLRLGFEGRSIDADASSRQTGVIIWGEGREVIPIGSLVNARVDRPTLKQPDFDPADHVIPATQGYIFEHAARPGAFTVGSASFRGRSRTLSVEPATPGVFIARQREPVWAAFAPSATGLLVPEGNGRHPGIVMPGQAGATPNLALDDYHLLRLRWLGTPVAAATLLALAGGETTIGAPTFQTAGVDRFNLVPGSIVMTFPAPGSFVVRDNGAGRLVGLGPLGERFDGTINYLTGAWTLDLSPAATVGNLLVDFEHSCDYAPLDVEVEWDALMAM